MVWNIIQETGVLWSNIYNNITRAFLYYQFQLSVITGHLYSRPVCAEPYYFIHKLDLCNIYCSLPCRLVDMTCCLLLFQVIFKSAVFWWQRNVYISAVFHTSTHQLLCHCGLYIHFCVALSVSASVCIVWQHQATNRHKLTNNQHMTVA